jgi:hypothetical protein
MKGLAARLEITPETEKALFFTIEQAEKNSRLMDYLKSKLFNPEQLFRALSVCGVRARPAAASVEDLLPDPTFEVCWR